MFKQGTTGKKIPKLILKSLLWILCGILGIVICLLVVLQFKGTQQYFAHKLTTYVSQKIKSKVSLKEISIGFPKTISLTDLYVEDLHRDTLIYAHSIQLRLNLWDLFANKLELKDISISTLTAHIYREFPDTSFNYSFIPEAFSSKKETTNIKDSTAGKPFQFLIKNIQLSEICFTYHDTITGTNADLNIGALKTNLQSFDLNQKNIHAGLIQLANTKIQVVQHTPLRFNSEPSQPFDYQIGLDKLDVTNLNTTYVDNQSHQDMHIYVGKLNVLTDQLDISKKNILLHKISLAQSSIAYTLNKKNIQPDSSSAAIEKSDSSNWNISLKQLELKNNSFAYNNQNSTPTESGIDFNHLLFRKINLNGKNISVAPNQISLLLNDFSLQEEKGFILKKFSTHFLYTKKQLELSELDIETNHSKIGDYVSLHFSSPAVLKDSLGKLQTAINLKNTSISLKDVLQFKPDLLTNSNLHLKENMLVGLNCSINGQVDNLQIAQLNVKTLENTRLDAIATIKNITTPNSLYATINLINFETSKSDIESILDTAIIPTSISIPSSIKTKGNFKGTPSIFDANLDLLTSFGDVAATIEMDTSQPSADTIYNASLDIAQLNLGKLLNDTSLLGPLTMQTTIHGKGTSLHTLNADIATVIEDAELKQYHYKDLTLNGVVNKKSFDGKITIADTNIAFNYNGLIDLDSSHPAIDFDFNLIGADLKALHLSDEDLRISTFLETHLKKENVKNVTGTAILKNTVLIKDAVTYRFDSLLLASSYKDSITTITLSSDILNASLNGIISLDELPTSLKNHIDNYFTLQTEKAGPLLTKQQFKFDLNLTDPTIFAEGLIPKLEKLTPFSMKGNYDSESGILDFNLDLAQLRYSEITIDTLNVNAHSTSTSMAGSLKINEISNPNFKIENFGMDASCQNNNLHFSIQTAKDSGEKILLVSGNLNNRDTSYNLSLDPSIILNSGKWSVNENNQLSFGGKKSSMSNFILKDSTQTIAINNHEENLSSSLKIDFNSFQLETFSKLLDNENELLQGILNGTFILKQRDLAPTFTSDIKIDSLRFKTIPTGNIRFFADNTKDPNKIDLQFNLSGHKNDIDINGSYTTETSSSSLNLSVAVNQLDLKTMEPFTFGNVTQMSGSTNGKLTISGKTSEPNISGLLHFNSCAFRPAFIDSYLHIEDEIITLESKKIMFDSFSLIDSLNNKATIDGYVDIKNPDVIPLNLKLKTSNFLALNTTIKDNDLFFGKIYLDSDISLKGNTDNPVINGKIGLNKGSVITYIKPENVASKNDHKGIVEFVDTLQIQKSIMTRDKSEESVSATKGVNLSVQVDFDKEVELKMLMDRTSDDSLYIKGSGQLDFTLDEVGQTNLTGKYSILKGGYHLTINNLIQKDFSITNGSSVTWSGNVSDPYLDISAVYKTKASPADLVEGQLSESEPLDRNKYRTLMTFLVYLNMNGFVSTPNINFDIQQPANERGAMKGAINAKLTELRSDESELNKQVFALLALNHFIREDPFDASSSVASTSRASASRILTQQLNNLSAKYVKGVDLNLGVNSYEDYSSGQQEGRTQLQVGISKNLLNDKVTVQVGGNIDLEGEKAKQNNVSDIAGNIGFEYKLTDDERYKLKGYRKNEYENPIDGDLIKTGFGVIYRRDYNKLQELISKPGRKKKMKE